MAKIIFRFCVAAIAALGLTVLAPVGVAENTAGLRIWTIPDIDALPDDAYGQQVRRGRALITATSAHIGPNAPDAAQRFAGNNLACGDCHLEAGTKKFGLPIFGLSDDFPRYSVREGKDISIETRLNACMTRSMNGRPMPNDAADMQALVAYVRFLSSGMSKDEQFAGRGSGHMPDLDRAADPLRGRHIYAAACLGCHAADGSGLPRDPEALVLGYAVPPLWGGDSFNNGAGMARISDLANFVHFNMPAGADYLNPKLSVEEAWDVAAYIESQPRPQKAGLNRDFPDLLDKPVDAPYGPYADGFSETRHKYGPFRPIRAEIARLRVKQEETPNTAQ
jgi:thiosulfate dehydrogenase